MAAADDPHRVSFDAFEQQPRQEFVKCVVVGDTSVGKTRLICSYVYDQPGIPVGTLYQRPRIPTVFAIDQYVRDPSIRDKGKLNIQGVPTQFRIWDTFGYHDKNRKYAYQNAHVVVLCFSIGLPSSLRNINAKWYPEIKKYCPRAPIILVGTQLDRRYTDPNVFKSLSKVTTLTDILQNGDRDKENVPVSNTNQCPDLKCIPSQICRQTSNEISADGYMEVSVVTRYGVQEVFEKAVRAALVYRRQQRPIFSSHLKHVRRPSLQKPFRPPKKEFPDVTILDDGPYQPNFMTEDSELCDITFLVDGELIHAHTIVLVSGCPVFFYLLTHPNVIAYLGYDIPVERPFCSMETTSCYINGIATDGIPQGFETIDVLTDLHEKCKLFIKVKNISADYFKSLLEYVYSGKISFIQDHVLLLSAAGYLQMDFVSKYVSNILNNEVFFNDQLLMDFNLRRREFMVKYFLQTSLFADVAFLLDNGMVPAHKQVLVSMCPVMAGMFRKHSFRESLTENVDFRDTNVESFLAVLEYLYTGDCRQYSDLHGTLQLANFLCLPKLVTFCEAEIVNDIKGMQESGNQEVYSIVLASFNIAQYHNAPQLSAWCIHFMATNYNDFCKQAGKEMKLLDDETLKYLEDNRWPPIWYLKEQDYYDRSMKQLAKEQELKKSKRRKRNCRSCFFA